MIGVSFIVVCPFFHQSNLKIDGKNMFKVLLKKYELINLPVIFPIFLEYLVPYLVLVMQQYQLKWFDKLFAACLNHFFFIYKHKSVLD